MTLLNKFMTLLAITALVGCGESKKKEENKGFEYEQPSNDAGTAEAPDLEPISNTVTITGNDLMKYNKKEIKVKAGEKVTLTLKHVGKLDKQVMGHNWVLLKKGVDLVDFATEAQTAVDNGYIPEGTDDVIAHTKMLGGGESDTIEFEAPEPGTYQFLCSFPGHYGVMQGEFIVED
ncbi:azurin [Robertkochia aurantiaca]|uniref:azurin n=1 Tax=Robertkochia aurantiaca TaxID=2873700 RepID=UPI001CC96EA8|nr:azurin [Robertkochia sp. 3YJGBD-33]